MPRRPSASTSARSIFATHPCPPHSATKRPPGLSARHTPAITTSARFIQWSAALLNTASNSLSKARCSPSTTCASTPSAFAASTCGALASTPTTAHPSAASFALSAPSPQPRSRMRSPGCGASSSTTGAPSSDTKRAWLAQLDAADLAAHRLRQARDELDRARVLVGRRHALHVVLQGPHQRIPRRVAGTQDDEGLHDLAAYRVGARHHGRLEDGGVLEERALDLEGPDAIASGDDDVVRAADEPEIAVLVALGAVARQVPLTAAAGTGLLGVLPVPAKEGRRLSAQGEIANLPRRQLLARLPDDAEIVAREGLPHRARPDGHSRKIGGEEDRLRLPVAIVDEEPEGIVPGVDHLGVQGLAGTGAVPQARQPPAREILLHEQPILGRRRTEDRDLVAGDEDTIL